MTQEPNPQQGNPLEALSAGLGGLDLGGLLQQAQQMQSQLQDAQEKLADTVVEGSVAGGVVSVKVTGTGELAGVTIAPGAVEADDPEALAESLTELGDLVVAAYRDARAKADALAEQTLGPLAGGMPGMPGAPGDSPGPLGFA